MVTPVNGRADAIEIELSASDGRPDGVVTVTVKMRIQSDVGDFVTLALGPPLNGWERTITDDGGGEPRIERGGPNDRDYVTSIVWSTRYENTELPVGDVVAPTYELQVPEDATPGRYTVTVSACRNACPGSLECERPEGRHPIYRREVGDVLGTDGPRVRASTGRTPGGG